MSKLTEYIHSEETPQKQMYVCIVLAVLIFVAQELGRIVGISGEMGLRISPFWPATGISLAALLLLGWRILPGIFLGLLVYNCLHLILSHLNGLERILIGIGISLGSLFQAFSGAYLIRRFCVNEFYESVRDTLFFLVIVIFTCMIAPTINVAILYSLGEMPAYIIQNWITFWIGDAVGVLIFVPLIISFALSSPFKYTQRDVIEVSLYFFLLGLATLGVFFGSYPIHIWLVPFLLWAIFGFDIRILATALTIVTFVAVLATVLGYGPDYTLDINQSLFYLITLLE